MTSVEIINTEVREGDELNSGEKYAIYVLRVATDGNDPHEISRRFSQFHELRDAIIKSFSAVSNIPFPPRKLIGSLASKTLEKRATELGAWLNSVLADESTAQSDDLQAFLETKQGMVKVGGPGPTASLTDIHGRVFDPSIYGSDWLLVYSVASRDNSQHLTKFMKSAGAAVTEKYPSLKQIFVNVANLRVVPKNAQGIVLPILANLDKKNACEVLDSYTRDCKDQYNGQDLFFHPDWTGEAVDQIGCGDSNWTFRVFVVASGTILSSFQSSTPNLVESYTAAIDSAVDQFPQILAPWPTADGEGNYSDLKEVAKDAAKISPGKIHGVEVEIEEPSLLGLQIQVMGDSKTIEFRVVSDVGQVILPRRKVECGASPLRQVVHVLPGKYTVELDNKGSKLSSKQVEFRAVATKTFGK